MWTPPPHPKGYLCRRAPRPLAIDGCLDKPEWAIAPWTEPFVDIEGDAKPRPPLSTRAKMLWDDRFLYIGAELEEPNVWATLTEHDSVIFQDNDFEVFLDPDGDNQDYYELEINAFNTTWDLHLPKAYRDGGPARNEWEIPGMRTAVRVDGTINDPSVRDRGWTVEIALPWKPLGEFATCSSPPRAGDTWRINFSRVEWDMETGPDGKVAKLPGRPEHNWVWSPQGVVDMHRPETWGYLRFVDMAPLDAAPPVDPDWDTRCRLMAIYHAQHAYRAAHGHWAVLIRELGVDAPGASLWPVGNGWEAALNGMRVRNDSRLVRGSG